MNILSAIDKALQETEPDPTPHTTAFITARNANARDRYSEYPRLSYPQGTRQIVPSHPENVIAQIILTDGEAPLCSEEELNSLRISDERMIEILGEMELYSITAANSDHDSQTQETLRAIIAGQPGPTHRSRASFHAEYRANQQARIELLRKFTHEEVVPIARPVLERFIERADAHLKYVEGSDRHLCAAYGLKYEPSLMWNTVASLSIQYMPQMRLPIPSTYASPRRILGGILSFFI